MTLKLALAFSLALAIGMTVLAQVPYRRITTADSDPSSWLTYSGNYQAQRYSALTQINRQNVGNLKLSWVYQMRNSGISHLCLEQTEFLQLLHVSQINESSVRHLSAAD